MYNIFFTTFAEWDIAQAKIVPVTLDHHQVVMSEDQQYLEDPENKNLTATVSTWLTPQIR